MLNCTGNKIPLACVFAAIAIVFIHGLSLAVAPGEPEVREPEERAWATAENEPARPKAGVVFLTYSDPRIDGHGSGPMMEVVYAGRLLKKIMRRERVFRRTASFERVPMCRCGRGTRLRPAV